MKKLILTMVMILTMVVSSKAMSYSQASQQSLFLSDKMAYELGLTAQQYDAVYQVNLDYFLNLVNGNDIFGSSWAMRNSELQYILNSYQYSLYIGENYFYRPAYWQNNSWTFGIYSRYTNSGHFYRARPTTFSTYRGGNNLNYYTSRTISRPNVISNPSSQDWRKGAPNKASHFGTTPVRKPNNKPVAPPKRVVNSPTRKVTTPQRGTTTNRPTAVKPTVKPAQPNSHFGSRR